MEILAGLFNHCVIQRNKQNVCDVLIEGQLSLSYPNAHLHLMMSYSPFVPYDDTFLVVEKPIPTLIQLPISLETREKDGLISHSFTGRLKDIPTGGPYDITLQCFNGGELLEAIHFSDILVGDVHLLGGQSNMQGIGRIADRLTPISEVRAFYMNDVWDAAEDPLHELEDSIDPIHAKLYGGVIPKRDAHTGTGPGVAYAQALWRMTGVPQGLIACAHGGTSMDQWAPNEERQGDTLYGAILRRFQKNGSHVASLFWYQGCSDTDEVAACQYTDKMVTFIDALRKDTLQPDLPLVLVQIGRVCLGSTASSHWNKVQQHQYELPQLIPNVRVIPSIDLEMDDFIHISGKSHARLGMRGAQALQSLVNENSPFLPPIELASIEIIKDIDTPNSHLVLTYNHVMGKLVSEGRPSGFELTTAPYLLDRFRIYAIELNDNQVILKTTDMPLDVANTFLHYGLGLQPYCNITDSFDRSLPVLSNQLTGERHAFSQPATKAYTSKCIPSPDHLLSLECPSQEEIKNLVHNNFYYFFLNVHNCFNACIPNATYVLYHLPFHMSEPMNLNMYLGYDGPVKVWIDRQLFFFDQKGGTPAHIDDQILPLTLEEGRHNLVIALDSNERQASGIFVRFERRDIKKAQLDAGPWDYALPEWVD